MPHENLKDWLQSLDPQSHADATGSVVGEQLTPGVGGGQSFAKDWLNEYPAFAAGMNAAEAACEIRGLSTEKTGLILLGMKLAGEAIARTASAPDLHQHFELEL